MGIGDVDDDPELEIVVTFVAGCFVYTAPGSADNQMLWPTGRGNYLRGGRPWADDGSTGIDDGDLDGLDLQAMAWDWGATNCYSPDCPGDLTGNGRVNQADLKVLSEGFGQ